jgi:hypothetical protein
MVRPAQFFPPMPVVGQNEAYYKELVRQAEQNHLVHAREAAKVGQYVTLGQQEDTDPQSKIKFFRHAMRKHCVPPPISDMMVDGFYERLADFVRMHAGREALRVASMEDDRFAMRERNGESHDSLVLEARQFFEKLLGPDSVRSDLFTDEDWKQLKIIRHQWL